MSHYHAELIYPPDVTSPDECLRLMESFRRGHGNIYPFYDWIEPERPGGLYLPDGAKALRTVGDLDKNLTCHTLIAAGWKSCFDERTRKDDRVLILLEIRHVYECNYSGMSHRKNPGFNGRVVGGLSCVRLHGTGNAISADWNALCLKYHDA